MLTWIHFGDLHASNEDGWNSLALLAAMVEQVNSVARAIDFVFLPGDNANHGEPEQYRRIRAVLAKLAPRVFIVPGDHDFEPRTLAPFYRGLEVEPLPRSVVIRGHRCLFLDLVSAGTGGPDFKLGAQQMRWLRTELERSLGDAERPCAFMHAFPGDLHQGGEELATLFAQRRVAAIDTGHTHYNEVLNDGGAIYTATRSTGQIEEGPPGFSVHAVDGSAVSWRFKPLSQPWPLALITSPVDRRFATAQSERLLPGARLSVRARVLGEVRRVELRVDGGPAQAMQPGADASAWSSELPGLAEGRHRLRVAAEGGAERDEDVIEVEVSSRAQPARLRDAPGDHRHSVGAWEARGLLGTQLGPNKNGTIKW